jgi:hypothetical protein
MSKGLPNRIWTEPGTVGGLLVAFITLTLSTKVCIEQRSVVQCGRSYLRIALAPQSFFAEKADDLHSAQRVRSMVTQARGTSS